MNTLRRQILALFILIATVFLFAVGYTLFLLQQIGSDLDELNLIYLPLSEDITQLESHTQKLVISTNGQHLIDERNMEGIKSNLRIVQRRLKRIDYLIKGLLEKERDLQELEKDIQLFQTQLHTLENYIQELERNQNSENMHRYFYTQTHLHVLSKKMIASCSNSIFNLGQKSSISRDRAFSIGGGLGFVSLLLTIILSTIALRILAPIQKLTTQVQLIGKGDYSIRLPLSDFSGEEIAVLASEINHMAQAVWERDQSLSKRADELNTLSMQLEKVLHSISSGIIVVRDNIIQLINPVATQDWDLQPQQSLPSFLCELEHGIYEEIAIGQNICNITVVPLQTKETLYSIRIVTDIVANRKQLQRSERLALVGRLLAQVTHEVRNPLSSMHLNAEMLEDEELSQEGLEIVTGLIYEIRRLEQITERYLNISRRPPIQIESIHLSDFFSTWKQEQKVFWENYQCDCQIDVPIELFVHADKNVLRRVLLNLLKNALEANCSMIHISMMQQSRVVELCFQDNGDGLEDKDTIFEAFYTTKSKGTGLGLVICRQEI